MIVWFIVEASSANSIEGDQVYVEKQEMLA